MSTLLAMGAAPAVRSTVAATTPVAPVRVLHVLGRLTPDGGVQVVVRRLARHVRKNLVELHIQTIRPLMEGDQLDDVDAELYGVGFPGRLDGPVTRFRINWAVARR